jgi:hypothetical protein
MVSCLILSFLPNLTYNKKISKLANVPTNLPAKEKKEKNSGKERHRGDGSEGIPTEP